MPSFLKSLPARLGIDRAVAYVLLAKLWSVGGGLVTLALITSRLTLPEQGTYYTFANILGLQIFLELGLGFVVMQAASHEVAHLSVGERGILSGNPVAKARLASLLHSTVKIYAAIGAAFLLLILPIGALFFAKNAPAEVNWVGPWCLLVMVASIAILLNPMMAFIEGCGRVAEVERRRLTYAISGNILCWGLLIAGAHLYCTVAIYAAMATSGVIWFWQRHRIWLTDLWHAVTPEYIIEWKKEIWPFQWRIAISWLSGYFIFQLFNPLLYAYAGAVEAGKMGLTLQIANLFGGMALAWVNTKGPLFGRHVSRREWTELDQVFYSVLLKSSLVLGFLLCIGCGVIVLIPHLGETEPHERLVPLLARLAAFRIRMLSDMGVVALFACVFSQHLIGSFAVYMRAHKKEPMIWVSLGIGLLMAVAVYISAKTGQARIVAFSWCIIQWAVALPWTIGIFLILKKRWHA